MSEMIVSTERRIIRVGIAYELLIEMMYENYEINHGVRCISGIPVGAEYVDSYFDFDSQTAYMVFAHESFEPVPNGQIIPVLPIVHSRNRK